MKTQRYGYRVRTAGALTAALLLGACASTERLVVGAPGVTLRNVHVEDLGFEAQTFVLDFDVTNPNPFPLPVASVAYGVKLEGQRFAAGRTESAFTIPARSDGAFAISVEVDLLRTAPKLLYVIRDGAERDIAYELDGELGVDIPHVRPLAFGSRGEIRLFAQMH